MKDTKLKIGSKEVNYFHIGFLGEEKVFCSDNGTLSRYIDNKGFVKLSDNEVKQVSQ